MSWQTVAPTVPESIEVENERLRWWRAVMWAIDQPINPFPRLQEPPDEQTGPEIAAWWAETAAWTNECQRLDALCYRIEEVGEDQAWDEYQAAKNGATG